MKNRIYYCIDMKSFYASVECAERGLNALDTNLVVADPSRGKGALCLAVSPTLKALGVRNRCRLFEIPPDVKYITAMPRMKKYIDYAADIYEIYLHYIDPAHIHVYSVDEAFIDATDYLKLYNLGAKEFAKKLTDEIALKKHIPATVGIGENLYLAKVALDITAKKSPEHMGYLTEEIYRQTLWTHRPITDFWQVARGTAQRLEKYAVYDMKGITELDEGILYKIFGINAELLIDHAWGRESCTMADIKAYKSKNKSVSFSQILPEDYDYRRAAVVMTEMAQTGAYELMRRHVITNGVQIFVGYSKECRPSTSGHVKMTQTTNLFSVIAPYVKKLFEQTTDKTEPIRRIGICFDNVMSEACEGYDLFTDWQKVEREKKLENTALIIKERFGKNAVLKGFNYEQGGTAKARNRMIGGHNADD